MIIRRAPSRCTNGSDKPISLIRRSKICFARSTASLSALPVAESSASNTICVPPCKSRPCFKEPAKGSIQYAKVPMMTATTTKNLIIALPFKIVAPFYYTQCITPCSVTILLIRWSNVSIGIGVSHNCTDQHTPINVLGESSLRNRS